MQKLSHSKDKGPLIIKDVSQKDQLGDVYEKEKLKQIGKKMSTTSVFAVFRDNVEFTLDCKSRKRHWWPNYPVDGVRSEGCSGGAGGAKRVQESDSEDGAW